MSSYTTPYGIGTTVPVPYTKAVERTKEALAAEGFGVLSEIDVAATLHKKLGVDFRPYVILGACNPPLAHRALTAEASAGALLPCNVVLREQDGRTIVEVMDPGAVLGVVESPAIEPIAREARERLLRVIASLELESN